MPGPFHQNKPQRENGVVISDSGTEIFHLNVTWLKAHIIGSTLGPMPWNDNSSSTVYGPPQDLHYTETQSNIEAHLVLLYHPTL
jgi:hypothetical protein